MNLPIRIGSGLLAATAAFIEAVWPMRDKPRTTPGLDGADAWPAGEHALIEAQGAGRHPTFGPVARPPGCTCELLVSGYHGMWCTYYTASPTK